MRDLLVAEMERRWDQFPGLVQVNDDGQGAARIQIDWRRFASALRRERAAQGSAFRVDPWTFELAARAPECPRSVLAMLFDWAMWDIEADGHWDSHESPWDLLEKWGHDEVKLTWSYSPENHARAVQLEAEEPGRWLPHRASVQVARAVRARLTAGSAIWQTLTDLITAANAAILRALTAPKFARGLAPPGMQAATTCAPAHAPPAGA